ncbi:MAG: M20 metallopeptidase family protein [Cellulosilyticaceae bacterium]
MEHYCEQLIKHRRILHQIPEVSFKEFKTKEYIMSELKRCDIGYECIGDTGILATIKGEKSGNHILGMRCDIDGLPIEEETGLGYASTHKGCMHACGHDAHIAMQLVIAGWLREHRHEFGGTVKLIFQPAEECVRGARLMLDSGKLEDVESFFGMHIWSDLPVGTVNIQGGARMASVDTFRIEVKGKGGHGSAPHQCVDAVVVAAQIVLSLQTFVSREVSPMENVVLSIGKISAGTADNIIAERAVLEGTIRGFNNQLRSSYREMLERICTHIAKAYRAEAKVVLREGAPVLVNDPELAEIGQEIIRETLGNQGYAPFDKITASEDFAEYSTRKPSVFAFVGCRNEAERKCYPHHNPRFDLDEQGMVAGVKVAIAYALNYLKRN